MKLVPIYGWVMLFCRATTPKTTSQGDSICLWFTRKHLVVYHVCNQCNAFQSSDSRIPAAVEILEKLRDLRPNLGAMMPNGQDVCVSAPIYSGREATWEVKKKPFPSLCLLLSLGQLSPLLALASRASMKLDP